MSRDFARGEGAEARFAESFFDVIRRIFIDARTKTFVQSRRPRVSRAERCYVVRRTPSPADPTSSNGARRHFLFTFPSAFRGIASTNVNDRGTGKFTTCGLTSSKETVHTPKISWYYVSTLMTVIGDMAMVKPPVSSM